MFKFTINNTEVTQGIANWQDLKISIKRDVSNRIVRVEMPQEMTFTGEAYEIINNVYNTDGYFGIIPIEISKEISTNSDSYKNFFNGLIFINECEFNDEMNEVIVPIRDNSFVSRINNNSNIEVWTASDSTKNGETLTPPNTKTISFYNQTTGIVNGGFANAGDRTGYDWFDLAKNLIMSITDLGITDVTSTWYSGLPDNEKLFVVIGNELKNPTHLAYDFFIKYNTFVTEVLKAFNLYIAINGTTVIIEQESYFFNTESIFEYEKVSKVTRSFLQNSFYSDIIIGSTNALVAGTFPDSTALTFKVEKYYLSGKSNINNTLDLQFSEFQISANQIENILLTGNDSDDDKIFLVQYELSTLDSVKNSLSPINGYFYNVILTNIEIISRYNFSNNLNNKLFEFVDKFTATASQAYYFNGTLYPNQVILGEVGVVEPPFSQPFQPIVSFLDESTPPNFDSGGNFDRVLNVYTAPATGLYSFNFNIKLLITIKYLTLPQGGRPTSDWMTQLYLRIVHSVTGTSWLLLKNVVTDLEGILESGRYTMEGTLSDVIMEAGDTISFQEMDYGQNYPYNPFFRINHTINYEEGSVAKCISNPNSGGEYLPANKDIFKASLFTFEKKMTQVQVNDLLETPYKAFTINNKKMWANEISINLLDNTANIEAISDIENSG